MKSLEERFWAKVDKSGECWEWTAALSANGYGRFQITKGYNGYAHRVSAVLSGMPVDDKCVLHRCDNRRCVRPDHLFLGSKADNNRDMMEKGRAHRPQGENNGRAKLTDMQVAAIRMRGACGDPQSVLAHDYGVGQAQISRILSGKRRSC